MGRTLLASPRDPPTVAEEIAAATVGLPALAAAGQ